MSLRHRSLTHRDGAYDITETIHDFSLRADEDIDEGDILYVNSSGYLAEARANASGTMHAIGAAVWAASSGEIATVRRQGLLNSSNYNFSGFIGRYAFVSTATAGAVATTEPGGSGDIVQSVGVMVERQTLYVEMGSPLQRDGGLY